MDDVSLNLANKILLFYSEVYMKKRGLQRRNTNRRNFDDRRDGNLPVEKDKRSESGRRKIDDRRSGADRRDP